MPNLPPEFVPPDPVELTPPERQSDPLDVDPNPPAPNPYILIEDEAMDEDDTYEVSPENQPLEERDA
jgi:hypothetical protein